MPCALIEETCNSILLAIARQFVQQISPLFCPQGSMSSLAESNSLIYWTQLFGLVVGESMHAAAHGGEEAFDVL